MPGRDSSMTGVRPTKTIIRVAMFPILSLNYGPEEKVNKVRIEIRIKGIEIVNKSEIGYL